MRQGICRKPPAVCQRSGLRRLCRSKHAKLGMRCRCYTDHGGFLVRQEGVYSERSELLGHHPISRACRLECGSMDRKTEPATVKRGSISDMAYIEIASVRQ